MDMRRLFDSLKTANLSNIEDPQRYVNERRRIVENAIRELSGTATNKPSPPSNLFHLEKLQGEIEQIRTFYLSPEKRCSEFVALIENRISMIEILLKEIKGHQ